MRVLWFTNGAMPAATRRAGHTAMASGHWMSSLLECLKGAAGLKISVATVSPGFPHDHFHENGVDYFVRGQPRYQPVFSCRKQDLEWCADLVRQLDPDLVHIHGSERFYGLMVARRMIRNPAVISLQGFLAPCLAVFGGGLSASELRRSQRLIELVTRRGLFWRYRELKIGLAQEREILAGCDRFLGRTEWDRAVVASHNPAARYYHVGEMLRPAYREVCWDLARSEPHTIICTNGGFLPRRGLHVLLRALPMIRQQFPDTKLRLAGDIGNRRGYDRFLRRLIYETGLSQSVELLGYLDAGAMAEQLRRAHVFVQPSFIENSSHSLSEAMQVGLPCVSAYTGGLLSVADHGQTALMVPAGDAPLLATAVLRLFRDGELASRLGRAARAAATARHAPDLVISQLLGAYDDVVANGQTREYAGTACPA